ncbi:C40 family peptidase [Actinocorallia populi]|uniref:C40 family peptidase n=1 Tax=Actinocorallia populi TaxID=2079200 RepID=UPI000D096CF3|nr:C40 family peptidase [Actinocorallia populi]
MRKPGRRAVPAVIGAAVATVLAVDLAVLAERTPGEAAAEPVTEQLVAVADKDRLGREVAPAGRRVEPQLMFVAAGHEAIPDSLLAKVRRIRGVTGAERVDGARVELAGKEVGIFGVDPSSFRNFTPEPTAKHDGLWRNVAAGDVAVSFVLGSDGGVRLDSRVPVSGGARRSEIRVGAHATMGIGDIDAVVSEATARRLGMAEDNVLLIASGDRDVERVRKAVAGLVPEKAGTLRTLDPGFDFRSSGGGGAHLSALEVRTAVNAGMTKLGMPYVWGGESDAEGGYDCSGLMQWAFAQAGVRLPRVAEDQARTGRIVPFEQARAGDMLIWANDPTAPGRISHIALYLGGDRMLVAPRTGDVIKIQKVYFRGFRGAVRIDRRAAARLAG